MYYTGIDLHKRYSVACTMDATGGIIKEARLDNAPEAFAGYFGGLRDKSQVVLEACWNWGWLYDLLEEMDCIDEVVLANPGRTRIIADAQIKTDKIDARALCTLLRGHFVARAYAPDRKARARKDVLRQRIFWVRTRTRLRNRIHILLDRHGQLDRPVCSDIFGKKGMHWLRHLELPAPDSVLLAQTLEVYDCLQEQIGLLEAQIKKENAGDPSVQHLMSLPGIGPVLAAVIAAEVDQVTRFSNPNRFCAYCGLAPTTYASGGKVHHGRLMPCCNRWLRWAFTEAAWVAITSSAYFGGLYQRHRARGKKGNIAITIVARRLCKISWSLLHEGRDFSKLPPARTLSPVAPSLP